MKGPIYLVLAMAITSIMGVFSRNLAMYMSAPQQVFLRILTACLILYFVLHRKIDMKKAFSASAKEHAIMFLRALSFYVLSIIFGTLAYTKGKYGSVGCIMSLPIASLMGILFFKEKVSKGHIVALFGSIIALIIITSTNPLNLFVWDTAYYYAFGCVFFLSFGLIAHKWNTALNNIETTFIMMLYGSVQILIVVIACGGFKGIKVTTFMIFLILCGGICNILLMLLSNHGVKETSGTMLGLAVSTQPVFALLYGFIFFSEPPNLHELCGAAIIICCLYMVSRNKPAKTSSSIIQVNTSKPCPSLRKQVGDDV